MLNVGDKILVSNQYHELITEVIRVTNTMAIIKPWNSEVKLDRTPFSDGVCQEKGQKIGDSFSRYRFQIATSEDSNRLYLKKVKSELIAFIENLELAKLSLQQLGEIKSICLRK